MGSARRGERVWGACLVLGLLVFGSASYAREAEKALPQEKKFAVGLGFDYATGDYGTDETTDSVSVPLTLDYAPVPRLLFELVIPYLYQSKSTTVYSGGMRFPIEHGSMGHGMHQDFNTGSSQDGLGDITLTTSYVLLPEGQTTPALSPLLYLKFPTADEDKGLGTGEFDAGFGLGALKWFGPWYTYGEGRYVFQGSNSDLGLKDYGTLEGQAGYQVTPLFLPYASLWWSSPPSEDSPSLLELRLRAAYQTTDDLVLSGYVGKGLTDGSPDYGLGLSATYSF
jgi:hypothetical protein